MRTYPNRFKPSTGRRCQQENCTKYATKVVLFRVKDHPRDKPTKHYYCDHHAEWIDIVLLMAEVATNRLGMIEREARDYPEAEAA